MPRQEFEQVVAQATKMNFKRLLVNDPSSVAGNQKVTIDVFGAAGTISEVKSMYFMVDKPTGATAGEHTLELLTNQNAGTYLIGVSNFGDMLQWHFSRWNSATKDKAPASEEAALMALAGIRFDETVSLRLEYYNFTNAIQNNPRNWVFNILETQVRK